jgi:Fur family peroxide stress response transcriptional regulator
MIRRDRKHSDKRDAILKVIQSTTEHPSAQWIYNKLKPLIPNLSLGTVYRNINLFCHEGLLVSLGVVNGEERFDGVVEPHPHLICVRCGKVADLPCPNTGDLGAMTSGQDPGNFSIDYRRTAFYGLCGDCSKSTSALPL